MKDKIQSVKVGDILFNGWASECNPFRTALVYKVANDKVHCWAVCDGKLKPCVYTKRDIEYSEIDDDNKPIFKVIGNADLIGFVKEKLKTK